MLFILNGFVHDWKTYGFSVAWYNVRFLLGTGIAKTLVGEPMLFHVHSECDPEDCPVSDALDET
jgi:hypothetical protein